MLNQSLYFSCHILALNEKKKEKNNPKHRTVFKEHTAHPSSGVDKLQPWRPPELMGQHLCGTISLKCAKDTTDPISWLQNSLVCLSICFSLVSCLAINFFTACLNFLDVTSCHLQVCTCVEVFSAWTVSYPSELFQKSISGNRRQFFCPEVTDVEHLCVLSVDYFSPSLFWLPEVESWDAGTVLPLSPAA